MSESNWWHEPFFRDLRPFFARITPAETNRQVRYLIRKLGLKPGMSFLDCPCGFGRVSVPMAKKGIRVVGADLTQVYLDELDKTVKRTGLKIQTVHSDMRKIDFENRFDAAGNLWTSFGYFENEQDNLLVLKKMYRALKPGGRFCLHVINRDFIIAHYTPESFEEHGGVLYTEKRHFEYATSINRGVWTFHKDGKSRTYEVGLRMYSYHELIAMFRKVGFVDIEGFSSTADAPITRHTVEQWVFGTKPR